MFKKRTRGIWLWTLVPVQLPSCERAAVLAADTPCWVAGHAAAQLLLLQPHAQWQQDVVETLRTKREQLFLKCYCHWFLLREPLLHPRSFPGTWRNSELKPWTSHSGKENSLLPGRNPEQDQGHIGGIGGLSSRGEWATVTDACRPIHG